MFNVGETDDLAAAGVTGTGLDLPSGQTVAQAIASPLSVRLIDRDGTRHVFTPVTGLPGLSVSIGLPSAAGALSPKSLSLPVGGYTDICLDVPYQAPAGVHVALWRYIAIATTATTNRCAPANRLASPAPKILGFAAMRPDRLRSEYDATGRLTDLIDQAGQELRYV